VSGAVGMDSVLPLLWDGVRRALGVALGARAVLQPDGNGPHALHIADDVLGARPVATLTLDVRQRRDLGRSLDHLLPVALAQRGGELPPGLAGCVVKAAVVGFRAVVEIGGVARYAVGAVVLGGVPVDALSEHRRMGGLCPGLR